MEAIPRKVLPIVLQYFWYCNIDNPGCPFMLPKQQHQSNGGNVSTTAPALQKVYEKLISSSKNSTGGGTMVSELKITATGLTQHHFAVR